MRNLSVLLRQSSLIVLIVLLYLNGNAQSVDLSSDLILVDSISKQHVHHPLKRSYIFKNQPNKIKKYNPESLIYGGSLYLYQNLFSQHLSADCLYDPSCSDFSKQVVREYGILKGGLLSFDRLNRCNRIAATDLDPSMINTKTHRFSDPIKKYR